MPFPKMDLTPLCQLYDINIALLAKYQMNFTTQNDYLEVPVKCTDLPEKELRIRYYKMFVNFKTNDEIFNSL